VGERHGELSQCVCHGDCHGSNARIDSLGSATLIDFDDGGPGWVAYDLAVFLWTACAFFPQRRALWRYFLDGYRSVRPIPRADLDAVPLFVPLRHIWLLGEYAAGAGGWGTWWLGEWFDRQMAFLRAWEEEQLSAPLGFCISHRASRRSRALFASRFSATATKEIFSMTSQPVARGESIAAFIPGLESLIAEAIEEWKVPGLAVAVVRNEEVALVGAYGFRDVEAGLPVTTDTQFKHCESSGSVRAARKDIVFTCIPAGDCMNPAFRQHCTGTFTTEARLLLSGKTKMDNSR
jgi:hypothetical protein